ncbi:WAT1-related protein At2g37460-like [Trifolium pratense]|uniref:WAT1-related protein At2g37460-like n=1 Tax=Trifolium pratense TaxID=57577 RepID=UPI001E695297|nr:WAT1-related protein At2g37460-like [Trifolium pratense]
MNFSTKLAMNNGMSNYVFVAYRNIPACLVIAPFAVYRERRETINITAKPSQTKILGTIITVLGTLVMTLVKGPVLFGKVGAISLSHHHNGFHTILEVVFILLSTLSNATSNIFQGIFCSGLDFYLRGQVMQARGPVFGTMFNPVCMILVAMSGYFFLDKQQFLGRVIGALIICSGLYFVVWGTNKDNELRRQAQENANANAVANP